jgi:thiamine-phosphate pyrophosphorylase
MSEPGCRLYLVAPTQWSTGFPALLAAALSAGDVAALLLPMEREGAAALRAAVAAVRPVTVAHGVALMLQGDPALAVATGCDGVHLTTPDGARAARRALGDLQLGVFCGASRDQAMRAGEDGADYVAFGPYGTPPPPDDPAAPDAAPDAVLISWWATLMELPVVASGAIDAANCVPLVRAGADFLAVGDAIWDNPAGAGAAVRAMLDAIGAA